MARYYFDIRDSDEITLDDEGLDFRDLEQVQDEAARSLADMARDSIREKNSSQTLSIEVRDDAGLVMKVRFSFEIERTS